MSNLNNEFENTQINILFQVDITKSNKLKNDSRVSTVLKYVNKLYQEAKIPDEHANDFKRLLTKCEQSILKENQTLFGDIHDLAEFLRKFKNSSTNSTISESLSNGKESAQIDTNGQSLQPDLNTKINQSESQSVQKKENEKIIKKASLIQVVEKINSIQIEKLNEDKTEVNQKTESLDSVESKESDETVYLTEFELKKLTQIRKIDEFCQELNRKIIEYEKRELSFDDLENEQSDYLNESKLKNRFLKAFNKLCSLCKKYPHLVKADAKQFKVKSGQFCSKIKFDHSRYPEINLHITKLLNQSKEFPDFAQVLEWTNQANTNYQLNLEDKKINDIAVSSFEEIGRILKNRRLKDDTIILKSRIESQISTTNQIIEENKNIDIFEKDPALVDKELESILESNKKLGEEKYEKIINEYALKQENNEDFEVDENDLNNKEEEEDDEDETEDKDDEESICTSSHVEASSIESEEVDDDSDDQKLSNEYQENKETEKEPIELSKHVEMSKDILQNARKESNAEISKKRLSVTLEQSTVNNSTKKIKLDCTLERQEFSVSTTIKSETPKPRIVECSSAIQATDDCIIID